MAASDREITNTAGQAWIQAATTASVIVLAVIAAVVSYGHMHALALRHGEGSWASALIPLSVDGMIVAASMSLLLDSRLGRRGGVLPSALLIMGAVASLAANVAVAEPDLAGRVIAAWPSFALTASYELLMRQVRRSAAARSGSAAAVLPADTAEQEISGLVPDPAQRAVGAAGQECRASQASSARAREHKVVMASFPTGLPAAIKAGRLPLRRVSIRPVPEPRYRCCRFGMPEPGCTEDYG